MASSKFAEDIQKFNQMYKLDCPDAPVLHRDVAERLRKFYDILLEELQEAGSLLHKLNDPTVQMTEAEVLAEVADWLGDIQVYCASEMLKYGMDNDLVLATIMSSNFSKLGADGKPIYREDGKVLKGPNYWKPEPQLARYVAAAKRVAQRQLELDLDARPSSSE